MTICDDGVPFNPCEASPPPRPASLDEAPDGGRGIWLMRRMSSSMRYARIDGQNRLELRISDPEARLQGAVPGTTRNGTDGP